mgnify:CR=1 FL=1
MNGHIEGFLSVSYSTYATTALMTDMWVVNQGFTYHIDDERSIYIPAGYLTDGASVPRWVWGVIPPWGDHGVAAVVHDYLCERLQVWKNGALVKISREECNDIFYECLLVSGVGKIKAKAMYYAVKAYSHALAIIYNTYDPKKHDIEKYLVEQHKLKSIWL